METNEQTAITPLSSAPPPPQIIWVQSHPLEHRPTHSAPITAQPVATRGALPLLIGVVGVGVVLIGGGLLAIALRPAPVPPAPVIVPQPIEVNPNCAAFCGGLQREQN